MFSTEDMSDSEVTAFGNTGTGPPTVTTCRTPLLLHVKKAPSLGPEQTCCP